ncbi:MAG: MmcQ/YjbR family DNA-binding protein [Mobilitalea sp.]
MNIESIRDYCISKRNTTESFPFGEDTLVFKVKGKIFALASLDGELRINLKCNPERAIELRERYSSVTGAYHMNKTHWNSIQIDSTIPDDELLELIDHSYNLVVGKK